MKVEVSTGEAADKLSVLLIKSQRIGDADKLRHVQNEIGALQPHVDAALVSEASRKYFEWIVTVNNVIWDACDVYHDEKAASGMTPEYLEALEAIRKYNAARFRIKQKIDAAASSTLREQKSYAAKTLVLVTHLRMGDAFTMCGAVRFSSIHYDRVVVLVQPHYAESVAAMYADDPSIQFVEASGFSLRDVQKFRTQFPGCDVAVSGYHLLTSDDAFWEQFYSNLSLPYSARWEYGFFNRDRGAEALVAEEEALARGGSKVPYTFVHDYPERGFVLPPVQPPRGGRLVHPNYVFEGAERGAQKPQQTGILGYAKVMEQAEEIHVLDSAFFCMACMLDLSRVKKLVVYNRDRPSGSYSTYTPGHQQWQEVSLQRSGS